MNRQSKWLLGAFLAVLSALPGMVWAIPPIQHWNTDNGVRVYFVASPGLPMVDLQLVFDAGSARDGDKPGLAQLVNILMDSGTKTLSADAVAERFDNVGAQLGSGAERDMAWITLRSLSAAEYLEPAVDTLASLLKEPAFAQESLERERNRLIAAVQQGEQSPATIAERAFYKALYGDHPYASPPEGTEASLRSLTREDIQAFHARYYVAANAVLAIVGDLDRSQAESLANKLVGELPKGEPAPALPEVKPLTQARVARIPYPSSQAHVLIGQVGIRRGDPDYFSLYLGNHVLGGNGLVSRLADEVREKRGLSYSTYSYFALMRQAGPFVIGLQTRVDQVDQAVQVATDTLRDLVANGPKPESLEEARQNITGGFALRLDSNGKIVQYLAMIGFYDLPLDYLQTFPGQIEAVTQAQVDDALKRRIDPDKLLTVIVGG
ncbi:MAG: insulinase family protein [Gammaproteobacteria bacterium]|nr:insulinase family protein [Gammaproteobacteria bacterium]MCP5458970.1 insulinase family protein [Gammaproteobacteria bacterium]